MRGITLVVRWHGAGSVTGLRGVECGAELVGFAYEHRMVVEATRLELPFFFIYCLSLYFKAQGKEKIEIIGAIMHKLLHLIYGVLKHQKPFDPNHLTASKEISSIPQE